MYPITVLSLITILVGNIPATSLSAVHCTRKWSEENKTEIVLPPQNQKWKVLFFLVNCVNIHWVTIRSRNPPITAKRQPRILRWLQQLNSQVKAHSTSLFVATIKKIVSTTSSNKSLANKTDPILTNYLHIHSQFMPRMMPNRAVHCTKSCLL